MNIHAAAIQPERGVVEAARNCSEQPNGVTTTDPAGLQDGCIDSDMYPVVLCRGAQNADILREISLGKGRHHTTRAVLGDVQGHLVPNGKGVADPAVFHEVPYAVRRLHHDIGRKRRTSNRPSG